MTAKTPSTISRCKYCGLECAAACPYCKDVVCLDYSRRCCAQKHDGECLEARRSRDVSEPGDPASKETPRAPAPADPSPAPAVPVAVTFVEPAKKKRRVKNPTPGASS